MPTVQFGIPNKIYVLAGDTKHGAQGKGTQINQGNVCKRCRTPRWFLTSQQRHKSGEQTTGGKPGGRFPMLGLG